MAKRPLEAEVGSVRKGNVRLLYDKSLVDDFQINWFDPEYWQGQGKLRGTAQGRGAATFVTGPQNQKWVIRHYRRGGAMANVSEDAFFWLGEKRARSFAEWTILSQMRCLHLPVPRPVAARVILNGNRYTADIITEEVLGAETLTEVLGRQMLDAKEWQAVGEIIAEFHLAGVHHVDLTTDNILRRGVGNFVVIDFDKARFRLAGLWQGRSIARLLRGIRKRIAAGKLQYFREADLNAMLGGYQKGALKRKG